MNWPRFGRNRPPAATHAEPRFGDEEALQARLRELVGRHEQEDQFRKILASESWPSVLLVSGIMGIGKTTLLQRFRTVCSDSGVPCAGVIFLDRRRELPDLLEEIAQKLAPSFDEENFGSFTGALKKYRDTQANRKSTLQRVLEAGGSVASSVGEVLPIPGAPQAGKIVKAATTVAEQTRAVGSEVMYGAGTLDSLRDVFRKTVAEHARQKSTVFLLDGFEDLTNENIRWLWDKLRPFLDNEVPGKVLTVIAVSDPQALLDEAERTNLKPTTMRLEAFSAKESNEFIRQRLRLANEALIADVLKKGQGSPQRLVNLGDYLERKPEALNANTLPQEAENWAARDDVDNLLQTIQNDSLKKILPAASPLRWFNATLLEKLAADLGFKEAGTELTAGLIFRSSLIESTDWGWRIAREEWRSTLEKDFRRRSPDLLRKVHKTGADYHDARMADLQQRQTGGPAGPAKDVSGHTLPVISPGELFADPEYLSSLLESLYHRFCLSPATGLQQAVDHVVIALFDERYAEAGRLARVGMEASISPAGALHLQLLAAAADRMEASRYKDAAESLSQFLLASPPTTLSRAAVVHLEATCRWQMGRMRAALSGFEASRGLFEKLMGDGAGTVTPPLTRMACLNCAWLAYGLSLDGNLRSESLLKKCVEMASNDRVVVAELYRVQALVKFRLREFDEAKRILNESLEAFEGLSPENLALARADLASVLLELKDFDGADRELDRAAAIYHALDKKVNKARVEAQKIGVSLARGDRDKAQEQKKTALKLAKENHGVRNDIGNAFFNYRDYESAAEAYAEAIKIAGEDSAPASYYSSLSEVQRQQKKYPEAIQCLKQAVKLSGEDRQLRLALMRLYQEADRKQEANTLFEELTGDEPGSQDISDHLFLGQVNFAGDRLDRAEIHYRSAVEIDPNEPICHFELGRVFSGLNRHAEAADEFLKAWLLAPKQTNYGDWFVSVIGKLEAYRRVQILRRSVRERADDAELHFLFGEALLETAQAGDRLEREVAGSPLSQAVRTREGNAAGGAAAVSSQQVSDPRHLVNAVLGVTRPGPGDPAVQEFSAIGAPGTGPETAQAEFEKVLDLTAANDHAYLDYCLRIGRRFARNLDWDNAKKFADRAKQKSRSDERVGKLLAIIESRNDTAPIRSIRIAVPANFEAWLGDSPVGRQFYREMLPQLREELNRATGVTLPGVSISVSRYLQPGEFVVTFPNHHQRFRDQMLEDYLAGIPPGSLDAVDGWDALCPWSGEIGSWVSSRDIIGLADRDIPVWDPRGYIASFVAHYFLKHADMFLGVQEVANLLNRPGNKIGGERLPALTAILKQRLANGISISNIASILKELDKEPNIDLVEKVSGEIGPSITASREIALSFTTGKWMADITLRISSAQFDTLSASLQQPAISIAETLSDRLGIPRPVLTIVSDPSLAPSLFQVVVAGVVRCCASLDTPWLDWLRQFPAAGPYGRLGQAKLAPAGSVTPKERILRALEEALWQNPGLLLSAQGVARTVRQRVSASWRDQGDLDPGMELLRALARRRIPVTGWPDKLAVLLRTQTQRDWLKIVEKLSTALLEQTEGAVVRMGAGLWQAWNGDRDLAVSRQESLRSRLLQGLGPAFFEIGFKEDPDLDSFGYVIEIHGLPRAFCILPQKKLFPYADAEAARIAFGRTAVEPEVWINPVDGSVCVWAERAPQEESRPLDPLEFLMLQLEACLREAAHEFCDVSWTEQRLGLLSDQAEDLVSSGRAVYGVETISAVIRKLVAQGIPASNMGLILDHMLQMQPARPRVTPDGADIPLLFERLDGPEGGAVALAEQVRGSLRGFVLTSVAAGAGTIAVLRLDTERLERLLREALLQTEPTDPICRFTFAGEFLRALQLKIEQTQLLYWGGALLITSVGLRPFVRRIVAAQFPTLSVISPEDLDPDVRVQTLGVVSLESGARTGPPAVKNKAATGNTSYS